MKPAKLKVDLHKKTVHIGENRYWYEIRDNNRIWYRASNKYAYVDGEEVLIKDIEAAENSEDGPPGEWEHAERRVKNSRKLKRLDKIVDRALERAWRKRRKRKLLHKKRRREKQASLQNDPSQQDHGSQKRTKWGIRVYSTDGKHYLSLGCWKSRKYPGKASISLGRYLYTVSQRDLRAMLEELRRGIQPEKQQEPI
jgi:hypothetical protein